MGELISAASSGVAVLERDGLLATKLHVPATRPGLVRRSRLAERLDEGLPRGLALVCAPAGYGKTVLLADWVRRGEHPAGWLSLDTGDNDPARFWRYVVAALDRARPGIGARVAPLLGPPPSSSFEPLVTALINQLSVSAGADQVLLVLDDYHVIGSQPVHDWLGFLLEHRPPGLCVVLASRSDPPLPLARLRARGQLAEVRAAHLQFTPAEAALMLGHMEVRPGLAPPETVIAALAERTEGWAAGLQLAALSLRGQDDVAGFATAFTGSHRYVLDYLTGEVLERQSEQVRTFLLETSVLDRLSGPLCDAVTGRSGSQALLEQVERAGLFLMPLDEVRGWWRYHHLFADLLRARLHDRLPDRVAQLHRNAATWHEQHALADDAIRHATAAGEMTWAARLIERFFDAVYGLRGEGVTIGQWITALPAELVKSRPRLLLAQALLAATSGREEAVEPLLAAAERVSASAVGEPFEPTASRAASMLVNIPAVVAIHRSYLAFFRGDAEAAAASASRALAELGDGERLLSSTAQGCLAEAQWLRGRLAEAERGFLSSISGGRAAARSALTAWSVHQLGQVQLGLGRPDAAVATYQQALELAATSGAPSAPLAPPAGPAYVGLGQVDYQQHKLDSALGHVTRGIALCRQFRLMAPLATGLVTLAWIRQATGDPAGALAAFGEWERAGPGPRGLLNRLPAQRARLLLAQGDLVGAARWVHDNGFGADDEPAYPREPGHLVLARLLIAEGRPRQALALLGRLHAAAEAQGRGGSIIEISALQALALAASGEERGAVTTLAGTLMLGGPQGYVRVFADEGAPMAALLGRLVAAQRAGEAAARVPLGYLARLQRAFDVGYPGAGPGPDAAVVPGIVDPLTSRELEVLRMLAAGRSNQSIAGELVVSLDTVKKHVGRILAKLGAANRTAAVGRARQLNLIP